MITGLRWWGRMFVKHEEPLVNVARSRERKAWMQQWALPGAAMVCAVASLIVAIVR